MCQKTAILAITAVLILAGFAAGQRLPNNSLIVEAQDGYEISFGDLIEAYHGEENLFIPIRLANEAPVEYVHLLIQYDASILEPISVAPAMFFQYFRYDMNTVGRIEIELECDLPPPPSVPPIPDGDTTIVYIAMNIIIDQLDRDIETDLTFYENPNTPFPDNFLMLDNGYFIVQPNLILTPGIIYVFNPLYGDINLNTYAFEMGDVITFINYLNGGTQFTARQRANSDCNRDRIPATISDLVYMINVINGMPDTLLTSPPGDPDWYQLQSALQFNHLSSAKKLDNNYEIHILLDIEVPLGGFTFSLRTPGNFSRIGEVALGGDVSDYMLVSNFKDDVLTATGFILDPGDAQTGHVELARIPIKSTGRLNASDFEIISEDYSDNSGRRTVAGVKLELEYLGENRDDRGSGDEKLVAPVAYPNPFNSQVMISFAMSQPGDVTAEIFDMLGRKVNTLKKSYLQAGQVNLIWNGVNNAGERVAAGIYLCRLRFEGNEKTLKLQYLK